MPEDRRRPSWAGDVHVVTLHVHPVTGKIGWKHWADDRDDPDNGPTVLVAQSAYWYDTVPQAQAAAQSQVPPGTPFRQHGSLIQKLLIDEQKGKPA